MAVAVKRKSRILRYLSVAFVIAILSALLLSVIPAKADGIDEYTVLMLHMDGVDEDTLFADSSGNSHSGTAAGDANTEQSVYKFSAASLELDGTGDYVYMADSDDYYFGTNQFTIDFWVRFTALPSTSNYVWIYSQLASNTDRFLIGVYNNAGTYSINTFCDSTCVASQTISVSTDTWYHMAVSRSGSSWYSFLDGTLLGTDTHSDAVDNISATVKIGTYDGSVGYLTGYVDELRISKGVARWTSGFTPETEEYTPEGNGIDIHTDLVLHCDGSDEGTTFTDDSGTSKTINVSGDVNTEEDVYKFGTTSAQFDGSGDYLYATDHADFAFGSDDFTVDMWLYPTSFSSEMAFYDTLELGGTGSRSNAVLFTIQASTGKLRLFRAGSYSSATANALTINSWNHVAIENISGTVKFFINGTLDSTTSTVPNLVNDSCVIGKYADASGGYFNGYIDEVRVSKGVARWTTSFTPPTAEYSEAEGSELTVSTDAADDITGTTATLNGEITELGTEEECDYIGFVWGESSLGNPGDTAPSSTSYDSNWSNSGTYSTESFDHGITSLSAGDTYYARACAHDATDGWVYGDEVSFVADSGDRHWVLGDGSWNDDDYHWAYEAGYITGTAQFTDESTTVNGAGTNWTSEYEDWKIRSNDGTIYTIGSVTSTTELELTSAATSDSTGTYAIGNPMDGAVPTINEDVFFGASSFYKTDQYVHLNIGADLYCHDMTWSSVLYSPSLTGYNGSHLYISGSFTLSSNMAGCFIGGYNGGRCGTFWFTSSEAETITTNGIAIDTDTYSDGIVFYGNGSWTLIDDLEMSLDPMDGGITLATGTLDFNDNDVTSVNINVSGTSTRSISLGTGDIYTNCWNAATATNLTLNEETATIHVVGAGYFESSHTFCGGGETYYSVVFEDTEDQDISGANTVTNLTKTGNDDLDDSLILYDNQTVTGILDFDGYSDSKRLLVKSDTLGTARTITVTGATTSGCSYVDFLDITMTPATDLSSITGGSGNLGGNSGITFTTATDCTWYQNSEEWSTVSQWSPRFPLVQDTAIFDADSFSTTGCTVNIDVPYIGNIDTTEALYSPDISNSSSINIYGNTIDMGTVDWETTSGLYIYSRSYPDIGFGDSEITGDVYIYTYNTTALLRQDLTLTGTLYLRAGTFDLTDYDISAGYFDSSTTTYTRLLKLEDSTVTLNGTSAAAKWNINSTNYTMDTNEAQIILTNTTSNAQTFNPGSGITQYHNIKVTGSGSYTLTIGSSFTCNDFWVDRTASGVITLSGNYTITCANLYWPVHGAIAGVISNVDFIKTSGIVSTDYLTISGSSASGGALHWYAGANSVDGGSNSGWEFTGSTPPAVSTYDATSQSTTGALMKGNLTSMGSWTSVYCYFEYGTTTGVYPDNTYDYGDDLEYTQDYSYLISGLDSYTTYYYRAVGLYNGVDLVYGAEETFYTAAPPDIETGEATNVTSSTATLNGTLVDIGSYENVYLYFEYGTSISYGFSTTPTEFTAVGAHSSDLSSLNELPYHFRIVCIYGAGSEVYGDDETFEVGYDWTKIVSGNTNEDYWQLINSTPTEPTHMYTELGTGFLGGGIIVMIAENLNLPLALIVFPYAFGISLLLGLLAYILTMGKARKLTGYQRPWRGSMPIMAVTCIVSMTYFVIAGGGVIPGWSLLPVGLMAAASIIFRQQKEGQGW